MRPKHCPLKQAEFVSENQLADFWKLFKREEKAIMQLCDIDQSEIIFANQSDTEDNSLTKDALIKHFISYIYLKAQKKKLLQENQELKKKIKKVQSKQKKQKNYQFQCTQCQRYYSTQTSLDCHVKKKHPHLWQQKMESKRVKKQSEIIYFQPAKENKLDQILKTDMFQHKICPFDNILKFDQFKHTVIYSYFFDFFSIILD